VKRPICLFSFLILSSLAPLQSGERKVIEVLLTSDNSIYEQALFGIQTNLNVDLHVTYLDIVESDYDSLGSYFQELENKGVPMIITIGKGATRAAQEYTIKTTIVFSMISYPKGLDLESSRLCGVSMDVPVDSFLVTLKDIFPDAKSVYSLYSSPEGEFSSDEGEHSDLKNKLIFRKVKTSNNTFSEDLNSLAKHPDALFIPSDSVYTAENFELISKFSKENSIILMSSFPALVKSGATFGITADYTKIGIETGELANLILEGKSTCEKERVRFPKHFNFLLNESFAKESNIKIPTIISERAKRSKLFSIGLQLLNEEKWSSSKVVFDTILKEDPSNQSALAYQQLALERLSGNQVKDILKRAAVNFDTGNYQGARQEYQRALNLNPNLTLAREGILKSQIHQSEKERNKANVLKGQGLVYESIRVYLDALHTYPQNTSAKIELETLRKKETYLIPALSQEGIQNYQNRDYDKSIECFEKILLIEPLNKSAIEYQRLSIKKREAIRNLEKRQK
jgi:putative ABC transport system substrate-binding protein